jgi:hypothetical protein
MVARALATLKTTFCPSLPSWSFHASLFFASFVIFCSRPCLYGNRNPPRPQPQKVAILRSPGGSCPEPLKPPGREELGAEPRKWPGPAASLRDAAVRGATRPAVRLRRPPASNLWDPYRGRRASNRLITHRPERDASQFGQTVCTLGQWSAPQWHPDRDAERLAGGRRKAHRR